MRICEHLAHHAARSPDDLAVRAFGPCAEAPLTYGRLRERVAATAAHVSARVPEGGVVMLSCANRPEFFIAFLGVLGAGRTVFPVHPRLTATELRVACAASHAAAVIGETGALDALRGARLHLLDVRGLHDLPGASHAAMGDGLPGLMLQSSGTTGTPKIVLRDGRSLDAVAENVARAASLSPEDRVLGCVPVGHSYGMENVLLGPVWAGACACLCDGFDVPNATSLLRADRGATVLPGAPFMFEVLAGLEGVGGQALLRLAYSAGSPLPGPTAGAFADRFGIGLGQLYGATEVGSVTFNAPGAPGDASTDFDATSVGAPMPGVRIEVIDPSGGEGQVLVHAPSMLSRYVGDVQTPFEVRDGRNWFPTGDLGRVDPRGRLWITGRLKLLIDIGGIKVNPLEVEQVLSSHPAVGRCVVIGVPVSASVSRIKAILTPKHASGAIDLELVRAYARERLSSHKVPRLLEVRDSLPLSPGGKVERWRLAAGAA